MENNLLDLTPRIIDQQIREVIDQFDNMTPEEKMILLEEYANKYRGLIKFSDINSEKKES